jgi:DNA-binding transcriptional MerR regulator
MDYMFAGEAARRAGITRETLLKWEQRGHIPPAKRIQIGQSRADRIYSSADVAQIVQHATQRGVGTRKEGVAA